VQVLINKSYFLLKRYACVFTSPASYCYLYVDHTYGNACIVNIYIYTHTRARTHTHTSDCILDIQILMVSCTSKNSYISSYKHGSENP
jgi:hypothetical protein